MENEDQHPQCVQRSFAPLGANLHFKNCSITVHVLDLSSRLDCGEYCANYEQNVLLYSILLCFVIEAVALGLEEIHPKHYRIIHYY